MKTLNVSELQSGRCRGSPTVDVTVTENGKRLEPEEAVVMKSTSSESDAATALQWKGRKKRQAVTVFTVLFAGYMMLSYLRKVFTFASPTITRELHLDKSQLGLIVSCQMSGYSLSKFMGGILVDRNSPRLMLTCALLLSGLVTIGFAACSSVPVLAFLWLLNGLAQGPSWPACAVMIKRWFPADRFGTWWSVLSTSMNVSGSLGPIISTLLISSFNWRYAMFFPGVLTIGLALVTFVYLRDNPSSDDATTESETKPPAGGKAGMREMLQDPLLLGLCVNYGLTSLVRGGCIDWSQLFLIQERNHSLLMGSAFISSQEIGGIVGSFVAGIISDKLVSLGGWKYNPRLLVILWFTIETAVSLHLLVFHITAESSKIFLSSLGFGIGFGVYGAIALFGVVAMETAPSQKAGTAHAIVGLAANVGIVMSGLPLSLVAEAFNWHTAFLVLQVVAVFAIMEAYWCLRPSSWLKRE